MSAVSRGSTSSMQQRAYEHVRHQIMTGEYSPGIRLDYRLVGREIGVSATPVREAMHRLEMEGLVELVPRLGAVVKKLDRTELREYFGVREAIESYAVSRAAESINEYQLTYLEELLDEIDHLVAKWFSNTDGPMTGASLHRFLEIDWRFHETIIEAANNRRLCRIVETCHLMSRIFQADRSSHTQRRLSEAAKQHRAILDALIRRDGDDSCKCMIQHIRDSLEWSLT
ncbi:MAG: GntR family transcriptional regulator [Phycisphaeraceae bacterium]|nr:GntR family transcriptional regulator [Phycisphaeraceae bacterium]